MSDQAPEPSAPITMALVQAAIREALAADRAVQQSSQPAPAQAIRLHQSPDLSPSSDSEDAGIPQKRVWKNSIPPSRPAHSQPKRARRTTLAASARLLRTAPPLGEPFDGPSSEADLEDNQENALDNLMGLTDADDPDEGPSHCPAKNGKPDGIPHPTGGVLFDPRLIRHPRSGEWFPPAHIAKFLSLWARNPLDREVRNRLKAECPRPTVPGKVMCTPEFDPFMTTYLTKSGRDPRRGIDKALKASQDKVLDVFGPLTHLFVLVDQALIDGSPLDPQVLSDWIQRSICLLGNANASLSAERRKAALLRMDPRLLDLANKELGAEADGRLFGDTFIAELRKHASSFTSLSKMESQLKRVFQQPRVFARAGSYRGRPASRPFHSASRGPSSFPSFSPTVFPSRGAPRGRGPARRGRGTFHPGKQYSFTPSVGSPSYCGQTRPFFPVLAAHIIRSLDTASRSGATDRVYLYPSSVLCAQAPISQYPCQPGPSDGVNLPLAQRCYSACYHRARFPQLYFSRAQVHRRQPFGPQSAKSQRFCGVQALQDGGHSHAQRYALRSRLVHSLGPVRCLPYSPHPQRFSALPAFPLGLSGMAVHLPPVRSQLRPLGLYKNYEAGHRLLQGSWCPLPRVLGRHTPVPRGSTRVTQSDRLGRVLVDPFGFLHQSQKVGPSPFAESHLSGIRNRFRSFHIEAPTGKGAVHQKGTQTPLRLLLSSTSSTGSGSGVTLRLHSGDISRSPTLQGYAASEGEVPSAFPFLRPAGPPDIRGQDGDRLVVAPHGCLERVCHIWFAARFCDGIRCQPLGLGSGFRQPVHWGSLVPFREFLTHQLLGTTGRLLRYSQFCQVFVQLLHIIAHGQCFSSALHQPPWGCSFFDPVRFGQGPSPFLFPERDQLTGRVYPRDPQFYGRLVLQILARCERLDVGFIHLLLASVSQRSFLPRLVRLPLEPSAPGLFQLASGPSRIGHRCLFSNLASVGRICLSPILHDSSDPRPGASSGYLDPVGHPTMAGTAMVPDAATPFCPDSFASPGPSFPLEGPIGFPPSVDSRVSPSPGGMDSFGRSWHLPRLSSEASSLLGHSWAPRTHRSYRSAWRKWAGWCLSRQIDPTSSSVEDILNFLSSLFTAGLAFRSINVARSAISASHDPIQGLPVGKHPLVCRLLKGVRMARPPCPRYSALWDVSQVFCFLRAWPDNSSLSLRQLSAKLTLLLCLISFRRVSDVRALDFNALSFTPEGVLFSLSRRTKSLSSSISYPSFPGDPRLCVVRCLRTYLDRTSSLRSASHSQLLVSYARPHRPVSTPTLARWIKWLLSLTGVAPAFGAHSVRGAAASAALSGGASLSAILRAADWSSENTFRQFYFRSSDHAALSLLDGLR